MPDTRPSQRLARVILPAAVIAAVVAGLQLWSSNRDGARPWQASVAVMPFENRTGDPSLDVLGRSLAEEVINRLTTIPEIRVIDPYTAASLMNDSLGTPALLDTLNVDHVIHGYVEIRGGDLIVNVSESDREGFLSLRRQHRVDPGRLDVQQVALAGTITRSFLSSVGLEDRFDPGGSVIGPGRDAYLAGNTALGRRTPAGVREAIDHFHEAIALEPSSAAALAALSSAYALAVYYKYQVGPSAYELAARSLAAADSAISLDPTVANGYSARGYIRALIGLDIGQAEADFARAEALAPNAPNGPSWSARILAGQGLVDQAYREARRARDLDPLQAGRRTALASLGFQLGDYEVTIAESREAYRLEEGLSLARAYEARALALTGRGEECLTLELGVYDSVRALCLHAIGRVDEAARLAESTAGRIGAGDQGTSDYMVDVLAQDVASYYGYVGNAEEAILWIEAAFDLSPSGVDERLLGSALFDPVRRAPGFAQELDGIRQRARARVVATRAQLQPPL
jgi:TolB-like protein/tetratricopeptide (TPR) repeat protein